MSTQYSTKDAALKTGLAYAGLPADALDGVEPERLEIGWPHKEPVEAYQVTTQTGRKGYLAVGTFRDGFDLWLIDAETGAAVRT